MGGKANRGDSQFFNDTLSHALGFHMHFVYIAAIKNCEDLTVMLDIYSNQLGNLMEVTLMARLSRQTARGRVALKKIEKLLWKECLDET